MPNAVLKSYSKKYGLPISKLEKDWDFAIKETERTFGKSESNFKDKEWKYTMELLKIKNNINEGKEVKAKSSITEAFLKSKLSAREFFETTISESTINEGWVDIYKKKPSLIRIKSSTLVWDVNINKKIMLKSPYIGIEYPKAYPSDVILIDYNNNKRYQVRAGEIFSIIEQGGARIEENIKETTISGNINADKPLKKKDEEETEDVIEEGILISKDSLENWAKTTFKKYIPLMKDGAVVWLTDKNRKYDGYFKYDGAKRKLISLGSLPQGYPQKVLDTAPVLEESIKNSSDLYEEIIDKSDIVYEDDDVIITDNDTFEDDTIITDDIIDDNEYSYEDDYSEDIIDNDIEVETDYDSFEDSDSIEDDYIDQDNYDITSDYTDDIIEEDEDYIEYDVSDMELE